MKTPGSSSPVLAKAFAKDEKVPLSMEVPTYENSKSETESKQSTGSSDCGDTDTESSGGRESEDNQVTIAGGRGGEDADTKSDGEYQSGNACSDEDDTLKAQAPPIEVSDTKLDRRTVDPDISRLPEHNQDLSLSSIANQVVPLWINRKKQHKSLFFFIVKYYKNFHQVAAYLVLTRALKSRLKDYFCIWVANIIGRDAANTQILVDDDYQRKKRQKSCYDIALLLMVCDCIYMEKTGEAQGTLQRQKFGVATRRSSHAV